MVALPRCFVPVLLLSPASLLAQSVHVVDAAGGPGSQFTTLGAAIVAASDGDVLLVRGGTYFDDIVLDGKSLIVQGEAGQTVSVANARLRNQAAGGVIVLRDLTLSGGGPVVGVPSLEAVTAPGRSGSRT